MNANKNRFNLNDGRTIPVVGLGTFKTANDKEALNNAIKCALNCGYEHFDCAWLYSNEDVIGEAIKETIKESNGSIKREGNRAYFLTRI
jgi:diketogulonate reductase-like aldo/keto reductase